MLALVLEPDPTVRACLEAGVRSLGHEVAACDTAGAAWAVYARRGPDLALLDWTGPGGPELCRRIREAEHGRRCVVLATGLSDRPTDVRVALDEGADDYLPKMADAGVLEGRLAVAERRVRRDLAAEEASRDREERYALAIQGADEGLWDWDLRAATIDYSARWKAILGFARDSLSPHPEEWFSRVHPEDAPRVREKLAAHIEGRAPRFEDEHRLLHRDGTFRWVHCRGVAARDAQGTARRIAGILADVSGRRALDPLTGLPNRTLFLERLVQVLARGRRARSAPFAVLFADLDRFKMVNDRLGHVLADRLLVAVARRLESCVRPGDLVGRLGGDEFAVLLDPIRDGGDATRVAERIHKELAVPVDVGGHEVFTTVSIGIALSATGYHAPEDVLRDADAAMYRAKEAGRGRYELFDEAMRRQAEVRSRMERDLRRALGGGQLLLHYQPIVSLRDACITGFEALLRWAHPEHGLLQPRHFISVAEETGLIVPVGRWALREALRQLRAWRQLFPSDPPLWVAVNVSRRQLAAADIVSQVEEALLEAELDPASLRLEIEEGALMERASGIAESLERLQAIGVRLDVQDFGTGASSLAALHRQAVDAVKVDRTFVTSLDGTGGDASMVKAILAVARNLGIPAVAEGVETRGQATRLRALGCTLGQGHYFSEAVDAAGAEKLLEARPRGRPGDAPPGPRPAADSRRPLEGSAR